jgi:hypothetical protein
MTRSVIRRAAFDAGGGAASRDALTHEIGGRSVSVAGFETMALGCNFFGGLE